LPCKLLQVSWITSLYYIFIRISHVQSVHKSIKCFSSTQNRKIVYKLNQLPVSIYHAKLVWTNCTSSLHIIVIHMQAGSISP
jgi:hypothetical protein